MEDECNAMKAATEAAALRPEAPPGVEKSLDAARAPPR
jgi:hypothetical protein